MARRRNSAWARRVRELPTLAAEHLNFFRLHVLLFTIIPLLAAIIFYWLNDARTSDQPFVSFTDSLFLCISAATVAGLFPVVLSNINVGQQIVLAVLTAVGSYSFVSVLMVVIRRHYFSKEMTKKMMKRAEELKTRPASNPGALTDRMVQKEPETMATLEATRPSLSHEGNSDFNRRSVQIDDANVLRRRGTEATIRRARSRMYSGINMTRTETLPTRMDKGFGGFPSLTVIFNSIVDRVLRVLGRHRSLAMQRTMSKKMPRTTTLQSILTPAPAPDTNTKVVTYITFDAIVGKNSNFENLSDDEKEELGGIELRALNMLAWVVPAYWFGVQLVGFIILAPYMSRKQFRNALTTEDGQAAAVNSTWFSLFQVVSSYANNGILVDASLVPFQKAYLLLWVMIFLILAGNTAFPCFFRFFLWVGSKCVPKTSQAYSTLRFLLDHPRRCFLYLFPSLQTWYLLAVVICLNGIDWILFLLLDIGNSPISSIPAGIRVMAGLFQAFAVRCGGFQIVALGTLAPAVQVLYVVMMYVGALPLALGVRSTNVYEDRSIALYDEELDDEEPEPSVFVRPGMTRAKIWGEYTAWHLKRQLSFDLWWLALAVFAICVFERGKMLDPSKGSYINVFSVLFEVVSGYGTVGLSLGVPNENFSLSGALGTCSKLVLCAVMLRGRHRGLPDAIDRSVLLPQELQRQAKMELEFRERQGVVLDALYNARTRYDAGRGLEGDQGVEDCPPGLA